MRTVTTIFKVCSKTVPLPLSSLYTHTYMHTYTAHIHTAHTTYTHTHTPHTYTYITYITHTLHIHCMLIPHIHHTHKHTHHTYTTHTHTHTHTHHTSSHTYTHTTHIHHTNFPGGSVVATPAYEGDLVQSLGQYPLRRKWHHLAFCLENSMDRCPAGLRSVGSQRVGHH